MPMKVTGPDGKEIEVDTPEEIKAKIDTAVQEAESQKQEEIDRLTTEQQTQQEKLQKLEEKEMNFEKLRNQLKEQGGSGDKSEEQKANEAEKKKLEDSIKELQDQIKEVKEQPKNEALEDFIEQNIGEDAEKRKLFDHYYAKLGDGAKTKKEIIQAAQQALVLAGGSNDTGDNASMFSTGPSYDYRQDRKGGQKSEDFNRISQGMGLSSEDHEKYGKGKKK